MNSDDRDFMLADWDEPAEYRQVVETLDVVSGEVEANVTATAVRIVRGPAARMRPTNAGDGLSILGDSVVVRLEELPEWPPGTGARLAVAGREWLIVGGALSGDGLCVELQLVVC